MPNTTVDIDHEADAARIVACVKYCAGQPTEGLEPGGLATLIAADDVLEQCHYALVELHERVQSQCADLLAALKSVMAKLREEAEDPDDPMSSFRFDAEWERLATSVYEVIANAERAS